MRWRAALVGLVALLGIGSGAYAQMSASYRLSVAEIGNFDTILSQGCSSPSEYQALKQRIARTADSPTARANALVTPQRNVFHVSATDVAIYETYYPDACVRATRMRQCNDGRALTAEQACDCVAGFIGDTQYGAGAGEVIAASASARRIGTDACSVAMSRATTTLSRARYRAQLGRSQLYGGGGTRTGFLTLEQSVRDGYSRANVDIARAYLRDIEFGGVVGVQQQTHYSSALERLATASRAGAREASIVVCSFEQLRRVRQLNLNVYELWRDANPSNLTELRPTPLPSC